MDPMQMLQDHHARVAALEAKFNQLVQMTQANLTQLIKALNAQQLEIAGLKAQLQQGGTASAPQAVVASGPDEVVGVHPVLGTAVTRAMIDADPKLRMRMAFSESDA